MIRLLIDADAVPNRTEIEELCIKYNIPLVFVFDTSHVIDSDYATCILVDKYLNSADNKILSLIKKDDILVTNDLGLSNSALLLCKHVIDFYGNEITLDNIDVKLNSRFLSAKLRKSGVRSKGPKKRTKEDSNRLLSIIEDKIKMSTQ